MSLHQSLLWLRLSQALFAISRVLKSVPILRPLSIDQWVAGANIPAATVIVRASETNRELARMPNTYGVEHDGT